MRKFLWVQLWSQIVLGIVGCSMVSKVWGQTNPVPHDLSASNFTFLGFANGSITTYPTSTQGWSFSSEPISSTISAASANRSLADNSSAITTGSIRNEISNGISLLNSGSNNIGAFIVALNTSGRNNISVTWTAEQLNSGGSGGTDRINGLRLQYRVGSSGNFTEVSSTQYLTTNTTSQNAPQTFNITLPSDANNESVVQVRWIYYISSGSANARDRIRLDDIAISSSPAATPTIALSDIGTQIAAGNVNQGALNHVLSQTQAAVTVANATLNTFAFTTGGTYAPADIVNFKLRYSTDATLDAGDATLSTITTIPASGNTVSFASLTQVINAVSTGYFFVTADIAAAATAGNTVSAGIPTYTFAAGTPTGTMTAGGAQTIVAVTSSITLADNGTQIAAGNLVQNTENHILTSFQISVATANAILNGVTISTIGTYTASDVNDLRLWYSADNTFNAAADVQLNTIAAPTGAGTQNFTGFTQTITSGNTGYFFITIDAPCASTTANTIAVSGIANTDVSFTTSVNRSGSASVAGTQTITSAIPNVVTSLALLTGNAQLTASWTNPAAGCFTEMILVVHTSSIGGTPSGTYTASSLSYTDAGNPAFPGGGVVVYNGGVSPQIITNLTNGSTYFVKAFTRNGIAWSSGVEVSGVPSAVIDFDDVNKWTAGSAALGSYADNHAYVDGSWTFTGGPALRNTTSAQDGFPGALGTYSWRLRDAAVSWTATYSTPLASSEFFSQFGFSARRWDGSPSPSYLVEFSTDGGANWTTASSIGTSGTLDNAAFGNSSNWVTFSQSLSSPVGLAANQFIIRFSATGGERIMIDNFSWIVSTLPTITSASSGNWNSGPTWVGGIVPASGDNVVLTHNVNLNTDATVNALTINSGVTLTIDPSFTLTLNGSLLGAGALCGSTSSNLTIGGSGALGTLNMDQTTPGTTNVLNNLTMNRASETLTLGNALRLVGTLTPTAGTVASGGNLTLASTASGNARVAAGSASGGYVTGDVRFERWMNRNTTGSKNGRAWRFVSIPAEGTGGDRTVRMALANAAPNGNATSGEAANGRGTLITGPGLTSGATATAAGFDWWPTLGALNSSSIRTYTATSGSGNFNSTPTNIHTTNLNDAVPYMLFVRGDRSIRGIFDMGPGNPISSTTTLTGVGGMRQGDKTIAIPPIANNAFHPVGNPFFSPLDMQAMLEDAGNTGATADRFWVWDANLAGTNGLGAYRLITKQGNNDWRDMTDATYTDAQFVQPWQAFFVRPTVAGGNLIIKESHKGAPTNNVQPFEAGSSLSYLNVNLQLLQPDATRERVEGVAAIYGESRNLRTRRLASFTGNLGLGITGTDEQVLSIDERTIAPGTADTLHLRTTALTARPYSLSINTQHLQVPGAELVLRDRFANTETLLPVGEVFHYDFTPSSDTASTSINRFQIIVKAGTVLPVTFTGLQAQEQQGDVALSWQVAAEVNVKGYTVEHSRNGQQFAGVGQVAATGAPAYSFMHHKPGGGQHFYRIRSTDADGKTLLTEVVRVLVGNGKDGFSIFPTVLQGGNAQVQLSGLPAGTYTVTMVDMQGKVLSTQQLGYSGGNAAQRLQVPTTLPAGQYIIRVEGAGGVQYTERLLKQ